MSGLDFELNICINISVPGISFLIVNIKVKVGSVQEIVNQKEIPTPKTEVEKNLINNQVLILRNYIVSRNAYICLEPQLFFLLYKLQHHKTNNLPMGKKRCRPASR